MTLDELFHQINQLGDDELRQLQEHIEQRRREAAEARARAFAEAVEALREGLTEEQIAEIVEAMNYEHVEPYDEDEWRE